MNGRHVTLQSIFSEGIGQPSRLFGWNCARPRPSTLRLRADGRQTVFSFLFDIQRERLRQNWTTALRTVMRWTAVCVDPLHREREQKT